MSKYKQVNAVHCTVTQQLMSNNSWLTNMHTYWLVMVPFWMTPHNIVVIPHTYWLFMMPY